MKSNIKGKCHKINKHFIQKVNIKIWAESHCSKNVSKNIETFLNGTQLAPRIKKKMLPVTFSSIIYKDIYLAKCSNGFRDLEPDAG